MLLMNDGGNLYILSDCKAAVDIVINRYEVDHHMCSLVSGHTIAQCDVNINISLVWIPGHSNIYYNDLADLKAKKALKDAYDISTSDEFTFDTCK